MDQELKDLKIYSEQQTKGLTSSYKVVDKLGILLKGNSKELDHQLAKLRKKAKKNASLEELIEITDTISVTTKELEREQIIATQSFKDTLLTAGEFLQKSKGMDGDVRRKLRETVNHLKEDICLFAELPPIAIELLNIYQVTRNEGSILDLASTDNKTNNESNEKNYVIKLLIDGLEGLALEDAIIPNIDKYLSQINKAKNEQHQIELCLKAFTVIIEQFSEEFKQTQSLILSINASLEEAKNTLIRSLNKSKSYDKELKKLNQNIETQINELSKNAVDANSIEQLQNIIDKKLYMITETIKHRDDLEHKRAKDLNSSIQQMENRLSKMEERTSFYRGKWLEEKSRSETDALTELPNRRAYDKRFEEELQRAKRTNQPLCLALIDIDHFKKFNDKYGHNVGDKTLQVVSKTLRKSLRATDYLARYGGEEFACILIGTSESEIHPSLEKVRKAIESIPFVIKKDKLRITISIGVTILKEDDDKTTIFERADKALYQAKENGRNQLIHIK